ncbi:hypothetical protein ACN28G_17430 [Micromonospora sp. WMMA1923]|uniref:hypothetical protein n=1 Tax=Micromonospora sp. WMMA1923 TaxID=3404125 RepID=UPI003B947138
MPQKKVNVANLKAFLSENVGPQFDELEPDEQKGVLKDTAVINSLLDCMKPGTSLADADQRELNRHVGLAIGKISLENRRAAAAQSRHPTYEDSGSSTQDQKPHSTPSSSQSHRPGRG